MLLWMSRENDMDHPSEYLQMISAVLLGFERFFGGDAPENKK